MLYIEETDDIDKILQLFSSGVFNALRATN